MHQEQKRFVSKKLTDALELVKGGHDNIRGTSISERRLSLTESLQSALSRSLSGNSGVLSRNRSTASGRHSRTSSAGQNGYQMMPLGSMDGQKVGLNGEGLDQREFASKKDAFGNQIGLTNSIDYALVIDGQSLAFILAEEELQELFLQVCINCSSVLCCRVSPRQKAQVTTLVRKGLGQNRLCLAIGDGANDVGMIQAANVGVGITGVEGAQVKIPANHQ